MKTESEEHNRIGSKGYPCDSLHCFVFAETTDDRRGKYHYEYAPKHTKRGCEYQGLYGDTAELLYLTQLVGKGIHIPAFLFVGDFGVDLCRADIRMPEHLGECFDGDSVGQADFRRHGMAAGMVNTSLSKRKRNIGGNMVTGCELVVFLCSATDRDRQNSMGY